MAPRPWTDAEQENAKKMSAFIAKTLTKFMSSAIDLEAQGNPAFRPGMEEEAAAVRSLISMFRFYIEELFRCRASEAMFAATILGCSALESLLMLACIGHRKEVMLSKSWKRFAKSHKSMVSNLGHFDLSQLTEVGLELEWFSGQRLPVGIELFFLDKDFSALGPDVLGNLPQVAMASAMARGVRNNLHPGRVLRSNTQVFEELGKVGDLTLLICLLGFIEAQAEDAQKNQ